MIPVERQAQELDLLQKKGSVSVHEISEAYDISELTARRDLDFLASKGLLQRTHGGAILRRNLNIEPEYSAKQAKFKEEKKRIGYVAASLVKDGDIIYINSGSTTAEVLRSIIQSRKNVTVVTNNIDVFSMDNSEGNCTVIFTGGVYRSKSHSVSGSMSLGVIENIYANKAFIGVDGLTIESGMTTPILEESQTSKYMISKTSGNVYVVSAHDKFGVVSNFKIADINKAKGVITDKEGAEIMRQHNFNLEILEA